MTLFHVPPFLAAHDVVDQRRRDAIALCKIRDGAAGFANSVHRSDFANVILSQLCVWHLGPVGRPALRNHIFRVIERRPKKQVVGVATSSVVAVMAHKYPVRDISDKMHIRESMRANVPSPGRTVDHPLSVAEWSDWAAPLPAFGRIPILRKPSQEEINHPVGNEFASKLGTRHCLTYLTGRGVRRAGDVPPSPGFSLPQFYHGGSYANH